MRILILNQAFPPDVVSSAQHAGDLARELRASGHIVSVIASRRAYDDPSRQFPAAQDWNGVNVIRIPCSAFGKTARWRRALDFGTLSSLVRCSALNRAEI